MSSLLLRESLLENLEYLIQASDFLVVKDTFGEGNGWWGGVNVIVVGHGSPYPAMVTMGYRKNSDGKLEIIHMIHNFNQRDYVEKGHKRERYFPLALRRAEQLLGL